MACIRQGARDHLRSRSRLQGGNRGGRRPSSCRAPGCSRSICSIAAGGSAPTTSPSFSSTCLPMTVDLTLPEFAARAAEDARESSTGSSCSSARHVTSAASGAGAGRRNEDHPSAAGPNGRLSSSRCPARSPALRAAPGARPTLCGQRGPRAIGCSTGLPEERDHRDVPQGHRERDGRGRWRGRRTGDTAGCARAAVACRSFVDVNRPMRRALTSLTAGPRGLHVLDERAEPAGAGRSPDGAAHRRRSLAHSAVQLHAE